MFRVLPGTEIAASGSPLYALVEHVLALRLPLEDEEQEFLRAHRATTPEVPNFLHNYQESMPFGHYLDVLKQQARGENLPPDHVPSTFLFAFDASRIVGRVSIRHKLNDFLLRAGGHIGYVVVPEFRRRGYATVILRLALRIAHEQLGIDRVLVTCDDDNVGSIRTIERNGGILEDVVSQRDLEKPRRRYWIEARASAV
jgi:predicted acetyltransferase